MAAPETNNALSCSEAAGIVRFTSLHGSVWFKNDDATNPVYIRVWQMGETPATMTTSTAGAIKVLKGEAFSVIWDRAFEPSHDTRSVAGGYIGLGYICDAGQTATLRYMAK